MVADVDVKPTIGMQKPRSAPLYKKADWDNFKKYMTNLASDFMLNYHDKTVEQLLDSFKTALVVVGILPVKAHLLLEYLLISREDKSRYFKVYCYC